MTEQEYKQIEKENVKQIRLLMDTRIKQLQDLSPEHWWEESINDELYRFLCQQLVNIKATNIYPTMTFPMNKLVTDDEVKQLASKVVSPEEFLRVVAVESQEEKHEYTK